MFIFGKNTIFLMKNFILFLFSTTLFLNSIQAQNLPEGFEKKYLDAVSYHQNMLSDSITHYTNIVNSGLKELQNDYKIAVAALDSEKQLPNFLELGFSKKLGDYRQLPLVITDKRTSKVTTFEFKHRKLFIQEQRLFFLKEIKARLDSFASLKEQMILKALSYRQQHTLGNYERYTDKDSTKALINLRNSVDYDLGSFVSGYFNRFIPLSTIQRMDLMEEGKIPKHKDYNSLKIRNTFPINGQRNIYSNNKNSFIIEFDSNYTSLYSGNHTALLLQDQAGYFDKQIIVINKKSKGFIHRSVSAAFDYMLRPNSIYKLIAMSDSAIYHELVFKTSYYNTLSDKLSKSILKIDTEKEVGSFVLDEAFDSFELDAANPSNNKLKVVSDMLISSPCIIDPIALLYVMTYPPMQNIDSLNGTEKLIHEKDHSIFSQNFYKTEPIPKSYQTSNKPKLQYIKLGRQEKEIKLGNLIQNNTVTPLKPEEFFIFKTHSNIPAEVSFEIPKFQSWINEYTELKEIVERRQKERANYFYKIDQYISKRDGKPSDKTVDYFYNQEVSNFNKSLTNVLQNCTKYVVGDKTKFYIQNIDKGRSYLDGELKR